MQLKRLIIPLGETVDYPRRLLYLPRGTAALEKVGFPKSLPKDEVLVEPGEIPKYCYVLKKGCIVGYEYTMEGDERIYNIMLPHSLSMEPFILLNQPSPIYFKTLVPCDVVCIDKPSLLRKMVLDEGLVFDIIESIAYKFLSAMDQIREGQSHDSTWLLCRLLLIFAAQYGVHHKGKVMIKEKLSQQTMSSILGVNRITIVRIVKKLKELDLLGHANGFYSVDVERMQTYLEEIE
jgi:CRP/FNR family transcriptional regulator